MIVLMVNIIARATLLASLYNSYLMLREGEGEMERGRARGWLDSMVILTQCGIPLVYSEW